MNDDTDYREHPAIANSDLSLLKRPQEFYEVKFGDGEREYKDAYTLGSLLDVKCFDPDKKDEEFIKLRGEAPSSSYHKQFVESRLNGLDPEEAYRKIYSTKKKSDNKIEKEAMELEERYNEYINFVKEKNESDDKVVITEEDEHDAFLMYNSIMGHKKASEFILADDLGEGKDIFTHLQLHYNIGPMEAKSELDRLIIDTENKEVNIIDLKTTGKRIYSFPYAIKRFSYHRQQVMYGEATGSFMIDQGYIDDPEDLNEWSMNYYLVVVEKNEPHECRVFEIPRIALQEGIEELNELINQYLWHKENDKWDRMPEYYENDGIETIDYRPKVENLLSQMIPNAPRQSQEGGQEVPEG